MEEYKKDIDVIPTRKRSNLLLTESGWSEFRFMASSLTPWQKTKDQFRETGQVLSLQCTRLAAEENVYMQTCGLDPAWYFKIYSAHGAHHAEEDRSPTTPAEGFRNDPDAGKGMRGGVSQCCCRYPKANKHVKVYDRSRELLRVSGRQQPLRLSNEPATFYG